MAWTETESLSFTARHDDADTAYAHRTLDRLEDLRLRLEERFEAVPGEISVIVHTSPAWLAVAHPYLPMARLVAGTAGRRYLAGFAAASEIHLLSDHHLDRRAAGDDSREALMGTADRLYTQLVVASNNRRLPPPWNPTRFWRYLRWAWLAEGAAQYFSGQTQLFRHAVTARMRDGRPIGFPPAARDATTLGGTVFDVMEEAAGPKGCERLVQRLRKAGPAANVEFAAQVDAREFEVLWRDHLDDITGRR